MRLQGQPKRKNTVEQRAFMEPSSEEINLPCDKRYRTSKYFLQDQLRCSEAAADFRSVKDLISNATSFNIKQAFQFQTVAVPVKEIEPLPDT
jgi:hypothetical protein